MLEVGASLLTDKVAIVTGGGGGIGKAISLAFASRGAKVVVAEINADRAREIVAEIEGIGGHAIASVVDVRERSQVQAMADSAFGAFGHVDILVNNVGDMRGLRKKFLELTEDDWEVLHRVNFKHVLYCTKAILPKMIERGRGGSIINFSTIEAFRGMPEGAVYTAFKNAVTQLTRSLAVHVGQYGVRMNAIAVDVTQTLQVPYDRTVPSEQRPMIPVWVPVGRFGTPDDIAGVAVFLASDLSRFVTGTTVHADGGTLASSGWFRNEADRWTNHPATV